MDWAVEVAEVNSKAPAVYVCKLLITLVLITEVKARWYFIYSCHCFLPVLFVVT